jgi:hypothetical protein
MSDLNSAGLNPLVSKRITPMVEEILASRGGILHSFHVSGSAVLPDYDEKLSNINSLVVLKEMDLAFLSFLAPLGRKYGKQRIAAPLIMTPEYISRSLDAFPIEFLDLKLVHHTLYGPDLLRDLNIPVPALRVQCERELKTRLIHLRQGYLSSLGTKNGLRDLLIRSITGSMALFRAVIALKGAKPPLMRAEVVAALDSAAGIDTGILRKLLALKAGELSPTESEVASLFENYYHTLESLGKIVDELAQ